MKQFNGNDYDTLYPQTQGSQIIGSVPIVSGGTGGINATSGMYNLLNGMSTIAPATNDLFPFKDVSGSTSGLVTLTNLITAMGNNGVITTSNLNTQASNLGFSKIQTGSYVGTGTYGASNPCSLTFNFVPKLLSITTYNTDNLDSPNYGGICWINGSKYTLNSTYVYNSSGYSNMASYVTWNNNTVQWYGESYGSYFNGSYPQMNIQKRTYLYVAIG